MWLGCLSFRVNFFSLHNCALHCAYYKPFYGYFHSQSVGSVSKANILKISNVSDKIYYVVIIVLGICSMHLFSQKFLLKIASCFLCIKFLELFKLFFALAIFPGIEKLFAKEFYHKCDFSRSIQSTKIVWQLDWYQYFDERQKQANQILLHISIFNVKFIL